MKRFITLILSVALLCPMWAGAQVPGKSTAQTTVGALSVIRLKADGGNRLQIPSTYIASGLGAAKVETVSDIYLTVIAPNNNFGAMLLTGVVRAGDGYYAPVTGALFPTKTDGTGYYTIQISIGTTGFVCSLAEKTLVGKCQGSSSQGMINYSPY